MEKKNFIIPEAIIVEFINDDIITGSGPGTGMGTIPGDEDSDDENN